MQFSELKVQVREVELVDIVSNIRLTSKKKPTIEKLILKIKFSESMPKMIWIDPSMFDKFSLIYYQTLLRQQVKKD